MKKLLYALVPFLIGCSSPEPQPPRKAVVEAWIDNGSHPIVLFTTTLTPDEEGGSLAEALLRWGRVTISDGEKEVVMTGMRNNSYSPPYIYTTAEILGEANTEYRITASFKELSVQSEGRILEPTPIDSIVRSDDSTTLYFTTPKDAPAYYYLTISVGSSPLSLPCLLGWKEATEPGAKESIAVFNAKTFEKDFQAQLLPGQHYIVRLHRVERPVFDFWRAFDNALLFGSNILFSSDASLPGNIRGGYGIFSARATSVAEI